MQGAFPLPHPFSQREKGANSFPLHKWRGIEGEDAAAVRVLQAAGNAAARLLRPKEVPLGDGQQKC
ncbi:MAG: hypothetical protein A3I66_18460 [Burkholderiales bacterium RIFCSPLOWO2_02_FULL_57_36]|nr:MAG: hypothetical protein A3I66_18460 [Burkholderiales bacterium RIFCSPLOWO2_02_FULL_57_36]